MLTGEDETEIILEFLFNGFYMVISIVYQPFLLSMQHSNRPSIWEKRKGIKAHSVKNI